jgi:hypothetical protein
MSADPALNDINDELVDYEEEEVPEGDAAKGDQVGKLSSGVWHCSSLHHSLTMLPT